MENKEFIPLRKRSKREQKKHHALKRGSWGEINPVTKKPPNPKAYRRKKLTGNVNIKDYLRSNREQEDG